MEFLQNVKAHSDVALYGFIVGIIICIIVVWATSPKEKLTVPNNAEARQLLKYHMNSDPIDSRLSGTENLTIKNAAKKAAKYR